MQTNYFLFQTSEQSSICLFRRKVARNLFLDAAFLAETVMDQDAIYGAYTGSTSLCAVIGSDEGFAGLFCRSLRLYQLRLSSNYLRLCLHPIREYLQLASDRRGRRNDMDTLRALHAALRQANQTTGAFIRTGHTRIGKDDCLT